MKVLKFGGSSIKDDKRIKRVKDIINQETNCKVVVVSAFGGVTSLLNEAALLAEKGNVDYKKILLKIKKLHFKIFNSICTKPNKDFYKDGINEQLSNLSSVLKGIFMLKELSPKSLDFILSFGELLSSKILSSAIDKTHFLNAGDVLITDNNFGNARVDKIVSYPIIKKVILDIEDIVIMGGFFGKTERGIITTMGLGASDYTASIVAAALNAEELQIWTDVNGFLSADPTKVKKAYTISKLSYNEALELSHFGAKVLYPPAIQPVSEKNISILIKNSFFPEQKGTLISSLKEKVSKQAIKGISSIDDIAVLNLAGTGGGTMPYLNNSVRLLSTLSFEEIDVFLISQGSSEFSITFTVSQSDIDRAKEIINQEFANEFRLKRLILSADEGFTIVAIVGEKMRHTPGISGKLFNTLGQNGINIYAIAQGSSELNISFVIHNHDTEKALNVIHDSFFLSEFNEQNVFLFGVGNVGRELYSQIKQQQKQLLDEYHLKINLVGIANSKHFILNKEGVEINQLEKNKKGKININKAIASFDEMNLANSVFVDCTASQDVAANYYQALNASISVVTANKIACSSEQQHFTKLNRLAKKRNVKFSYETNVGAGLPILTTIRDLINSGDHILKLEAVLSGTLNYIFNEISDKVTLSQAILKAKELGYSEPDPRIDLSGIDVIRKLLILTRESGYQIEKEQIEINEFLPEFIRKQKTFDAFLEAVKSYDKDFENKRKKVELNDEKWRYVAKMENGKGLVQLQTVDKSHPFYDLEGSNNIIQIITERYKHHPMIIKGYGAGSEVTAAGVFADIMRIVNVY